MYFIGLDVHKRTISYCAKDAAGHVHQEGKIGSTRRELDSWIKTLPQPRMIAMEATIFTGWIEVGFPDRYSRASPGGTRIARRPSPGGKLPETGMRRSLWRRERLCG
jgi:hypothetical protein